MRHGVFLRPDPLTCAAVTRITTQLRAQYGLLSAGAFPPHVTLPGSLPIAPGEPALVRALDDALAPVAPVHSPRTTCSTRVDLRDEVEEYVRGLEIDVPASFTADTVALYSFEHPSWTGAWWGDMRWEHRRSWRLRRSEP